MTFLILWDWDNTLADTFTVIVKAQHDTQKHFNIPLLSKKEIALCMNESSLSIFTKLLGKKLAQKGVDYFWQAYLKYAQQLTLKKGALEALKTSKNKGFINVLASNKEIDVLQSEVNLLNVESYFDKIMGAKSAKENKPSPLFIKEATKGFTFDKIICIGDRKSDILMAKNTHNALSILVESDPKSAEFKDCQPDYNVKDMDGVVKILTEVL